ncbi:LysR family transcriptional regulator ArgP [Gephyromycinifex aptenodytis]|uniref:LysR family transcriptional regulator ArgP n=1 Tax=Gephyromycinifex aptenodytis TaxID=2716227 RepID=UPI0014484DBC|nr:LysR family transcriptional regulator ArgP [Gephyromycinifex aptenodytis]
MQLDQLRTLVAVIDEGSFEAAADELRVTPSAVSQRIKALEKSVGQIVVRRSTPCEPTQAGIALLRMARQVQTLEIEMRDALGSDGSARAMFPLAVNADSLATWFAPVLAQVARWEDTGLHLHVEDQDHTAHLLRRGEITAAVTTQARPVGGCRSEPLGRMRYVPVAAPSLHERFVAGGVVAWDRLPVLRFNVKDALQERALLQRGVQTPPPSHTIPSSEGMLVAVLAGLGWAMMPELQVDAALRAGALVLLETRRHEDVELYWQSWALESRRLTRLGEVVRAAAADTLRGGNRRHF